MEKPHTPSIDGLLCRYCAGTATPEERSQVEEWILQSEENQKIARQIYHLYLATDTFQTLRHTDTEKALRKVSKKMKATRLPSWWLQIQRIAAILLIPLAIAYCISYFKSDVPAAQWVEIRTQPGTTATLVLPDSSVVVLNSESVLRYPTLFAENERKVSLEGEGYFSVAKDPEKQFILHTPGEGEIRVYGTEFNVEAYPKDPLVKTTLVSGKVSFTFNGRSAETLLSPGQKATYDPGKKTVTVAETFVEGAIAWKDGKLIFRDTPFDEIVDRLGKQYGVDFIIRHQELRNYTFTGTFERQPLNRILEHFTLSSKIRFKPLEENNSSIQREKEKIEVY